jgi:two-component system, OmpR family, sensor histidine kinase SenX3
LKPEGLALWVVGFAVYGAVLLVFLFGLERLFIAERDGALADVAAQRRALETYAERSLKQLLRERLDVSDPEFDRAAKDPYLDDASLRLVVDGEVVLPRMDRGAPKENELGARKILQLMEGDPRVADLFRGVDQESPLWRRLQLAAKVRSASNVCWPAELNSATQAFLSDEALYQVPVGWSAVMSLVVIESLARCTEVNPELLQRLLRDGMPTTDGATVEGLQSRILRKRSTLSSTDLTFLCERTSALSKRLSVDDTDFVTRCASRVSFEGWPREFAEGELLEPGWYYRTRGTVTRGVRVDAEALLQAISAEMAERGLLAREDVLSSATTAGVSLDEARVRLWSPALDGMGGKAQQRLAAKTGLLVAFAALAVALAAGALVSQRRKQRYLELKSDFVAAVSHELRTPLASLRVMAETLERRLEGEPRAKDYPRRIVAEADALSGLVENILSFNRLDKDRWVAQPRELALAELQKGLEEEARSYGLAQVELTFEGFEHERVQADPELLKLLLSNLLRNACRYNANDPVRVRFAASRNGRALELRVFDNGVGIPPGEREGVFEEFKRLKGQAGRGGPGSGLGLSLCRRIMGLHGGTLTLETSSAAGSTFLMRFS